MVETLENNTNINITGLKDQMAGGNQLAIFNLTIEVIGEPKKQIQLVVGQGLEPETAELRV